MSKIFLIAIASLLLHTSVFGQTPEARLAEIQGLWQTSKEGFLQYRKTVEVPGVAKLDLYKRAKVYYLTHGYNSLDEKAAGAVILLGGAHTFREVQASESNGVRSTADATYYLHVGAEDGKAMLVITCIQYLFRIDSGRDSGYDEVLISTLYPVNPQGRKSDAIIDAFCGMTRSATARLAEVEKALKEELP